MATETLLASSARTAVTTSADVFTSLVNQGRGLMLILDVTATPNNAETLTPAIQIKDPTSGKYQTLTVFAALKGEELGATPSTATFVYTLYPASLETAATPNHEVQALPAPALWRARLTPSSTGSWTYSLSYQTVQ